MDPHQRGITSTRLVTGGPVEFPAFTSQPPLILHDGPAQPPAAAGEMKYPALHLSRTDTGEKLDLQSVEPVPVAWDTGASRTLPLLKAACPLILLHFLLWVLLLSNQKWLQSLRQIQVTSNTDMVMDQTLVSRN